MMTKTKAKAQAQARDGGGGAAGGGMSGGRRVPRRVLMCRVGKLLLDNNANPVPGTVRYV
jgi:hypothetical protein